MKIVAFYPTTREVRYVAGIRSEICGMGYRACYEFTAEFLRRERPDLLILAGTAGAYSWSGLCVGDIVAVEAECDEKGNIYESPPLTGFTAVRSNTVRTIEAENIRLHEAAIENMEGAAFFAACREVGQLCAELRVVSNMVAAPRTEWHIDEASDILASKLSTFNLQLPTHKIRCAISPCPNDTFMFEALLAGRVDTEGLIFEAHFADIEQLNEALLAGYAIEDAMVSKASYAVLPAISERYKLLDCGSALGRGNGPLLVARERLMPADLASRCIAIPGEHTTANRLMDWLFPAIKNKTPMLFSHIAAAVASGEYDAGVLIHEGRFTYREQGLHLVADLGAEWERSTGLPLPLGAIVASCKLPKEVLARIERSLRRSIEYAFAHPDISAEFVRTHAQEMDEAVIRSHIALFVNEFSLSLGKEGRKAVRKFCTPPPDCHYE